MQYKSFVKYYLAAVVVCMSVIIAVNYLVDPLQLYRKASLYSPTLSTEQRYQNPGLAKNYPYDTIIIGTSMTENFIPAYVDSKLGTHTLKLSISGSSAKEQYLTARLALGTGKVKNVIWCLEYSSFRGAPDRVRDDYGSFPLYLYDGNLLNDIKYLLGRDTLEDSAGILFSLISGKSSRNASSNLDTLNSWWEGSTFSVQNTLNSYMEYKNDSSIKPEEYKIGNIIESVDANLIPLLKKYDGVRFILYFPPYSILRYKFFYDKDSELFYNELAMKEYIYKKAGNLNNVSVYDFQSDSSITFNLDNYKDISHHSQEINNYIIDCIASGDHRVSGETLAASDNELKKQVEDLDVQKCFLSK